MKTWCGVVVVGSLVVGCGGQAIEATPGTEGIENAEALSVGESADSTSPLKLETVRRLKSFFPVDAQDPYDWATFYPDSLVSSRDELYFAINQDSHSALWKSDATARGTVEVKSFDSAVDGHTRVGQLTPVGDQVFFVANGTPNELFVSNGTERGTRALKPLGSPVGWNQSYELVALGKSLLFFQNNAATSTTPKHIDLWKSDGTASGTVLVKDLGANANVYQRFVVGSTLYFVSSDPAHGTELWKSDGTVAGTQLVRDLAPGADSSNPSDFLTDGKSLYFTASVNAHRALWKTDGRATGTVLVYNFDQDAIDTHLTPIGLVGTTLCFKTQGADHLIRLYAVNIGGAGLARRQLIATLPSPITNYEETGDPSITPMGAGGKIFFSYTLPSGRQTPLDVQLWVTDGTPGGTRQLNQTLSRSDEFPAQLYSAGDRVFFPAMTSHNGIEPGTSDGTDRGTRVLKDIRQGAQSSFPRSFTAVGDAVFFVAYDSQHGNSLWVLPHGS